MILSNIKGIEWKDIHYKKHVTTGSLHLLNQIYQ